MTTTNRVLAALLGVLVIALAIGAGVVLGGGDGEDASGDPASAAGPTGSDGSSPSSSPTPEDAEDAGGAEDSPDAATSTPSPTPSPSSSPSGGPTGDSSDGSGEQTGGPAAYVVASAQGVVRRVDGEDTPVTARAASVAWGIDDLVVYETDGAPGTATEVRAWSPRRDRALPVGEGADGSRLLGAGSLDGRAVALVSENVPGGTSTDVTDRLVAVDLGDASRTVYSEGRRSFESGWIAAAVLPDGDVVATRQSSVVLQLERLTPGGEQRWSVRVAEDRPANLAVIADEPSIVLPGVGEQRGDRLRVDTYGADGSRTARTTVDLQQTLPGRVACRDWYAVDRLACSTDDEPRTVVVRGSDGGAVTSLRGAPNAAVTAVATTG